MEKKSDRVLNLAQGSITIDFIRIIGASHTLRRVL